MREGGWESVACKVDAAEDDLAAKRRKKLKRSAAVAVAATGGRGVCVSTGEMKAQ